MFIGVIWSDKPESQQQRWRTVFTMAVGFDLAILRTDRRIRIIHFAELGERLVRRCIPILGKPILERDFHKRDPPERVFSVSSPQRLAAGRLGRNYRKS